MALNHWFPTHPGSAELYSVSKFESIFKIGYS